MTYQPIDLQDCISQYQPISPTQAMLESFRKSLKIYLSHITDSKASKESEEFEKNILRDFLRQSFNYQTNTKGKIDLAIYEDYIPKVICEVKSQNAQKDDFINHEDNSTLECKAFYESILYYLRESITHKNNNITHIILTNIKDFYLINAKEYVQFGKNKDISQVFKNCDYKEGNDTSTKRFYDEVAKILPKLDSTLHYTHFRLDKRLLDSKKSLSTLSLIYQALSPFVLLKRKSYIDANTLNEDFYKELLYILGLEEKTQNGKTLITLSQTKNTLSHRIREDLTLNEHKDFETIFSLLMIWNNRILFLRLLESMLLSFGHINKAFLSLDSIADFATLNTLFFDVLAKKEEGRKDIPKPLANIPYLNSSLFDKTDLENKGKEIKSLASKPLKLYKDSILYKDKSFCASLSLNTQAKDSTLPLLEYLFAFLHAYNFTTTPKDIQEHTKTNYDKLINASVLGLVFEKLNGYKEGSFYTPSFITNYICKESITKIVIDKFNTAYKWDARDFKDIITSAREDNLQQKDLLAILLSIRICDPSVGSGHFLVSALNEMVYIAYKIGLLESFNLNTTLELNNDEIVIRQNGMVFNYKKPGSPNELHHKIQVELFNLKRNLIESCLFGVDINPNSCEITKLRLWIELLKYSYYKDIENKHLETLPNIDINIKCGNSLTSNIALDITKDSLIKQLKAMANRNASLAFSAEFASTANDLQNKLPKKIEEYKNAVNAYKNETNADFKELHEQTIAECQNFIIGLFYKMSDEYRNFKESLANYLRNSGYYGIDEGKIKNEPLDSVVKKRLNEYITDFNFHKTLKIPEDSVGFVEKELIDLVDYFQKYENFKNNQNSFEWRFEFPEVLDSDGNFLGFDLIIGNPPYIRQEKIKHLKLQLQKAFSIYKGTSDIYTYFYEQGYKILKQGGILSFITSNKWCRAGYGEPLREFLLENTTMNYYLDLNGVKVFDSATVDTSILEFSKAKAQSNHTLRFANPKDYNPKDDKPLSPNFITIPQNSLKTEAFIFGNQDALNLKAKIEKLGTPLKDWDININYGIKTGYNEAFIIDTNKRDEILAKCKDEEERARTNELIKPILRGKDIKRYSYEWAGLWIINTHNGYTKDKIKIPPIDIEEYPTLKAYFDEIGKNHKGKGKGLFDRDDKGITPYNLRNCAYLPEFAKEKIVYSEIVREPQFYLDNGEFKFGHFYAEATSFILSGNASFKDSLEYLLGILHSKLATFAFKEFYAGGGLGENGYRYKKAFLEKLPIPKINKDEQKAFIALVQSIINHKKQGKSTKELENELDTKIYTLYNLSNEEIAIISGGGGKYRTLTLALLLLASVESQCLTLVKILCENFESELSEAFRFCEGLKLPCVEKGAKISWQRVTQKPSFVLESDYYLLDSMAFLTHYSLEELHYLLGFLNSKAIFYYFKNIGHLYSDKGFLLSNQYVERFPVPQSTKIDKQTHQEIIDCVKEILKCKKENSSSNTAKLENHLDSLIYQIYNLNEDEISLIESEFTNTERERERERTEIIENLYHLLESFMGNSSSQYQGKIIWAEMTNTPCFVYDDKGYYINQTCYFIPTDDKYLCALLNSKLIYFTMQQMASSLGDGAFRWIKQFIEKLPIVKIDSKNQKTADSIIALVDEILSIKAKDSTANTSELESQIDNLVYKLYNLTNEEIKIIES